MTDQAGFGWVLLVLGLVVAEMVLWARFTINPTSLPPPMPGWND